MLLNLNQKGGIDCNSCAWADPDDDRTLAEFCESGAKAIADEATTKRVAPEFIAKITVKESATCYPETDAFVPLKSTTKKSNCPISKAKIITVAPFLHNGERIFSGEFER